MKEISKKLLFSAFAVFLVFSLSGCTVKKKATTTTADSSSSPTAQASPGTTANVTGGVSSSATATTGETADGVSSAEQINQIYLENLKIATDNANASLKNTAKYCSVVVEFAVKDYIENATQTFLFTSDNAGVKDWYWAIQFDLLEKSKKEFFSAKRNYTDITCTKYTQEQPKIGYGEAIEKAIETNALSALDSVDATKVKISLGEEAWNFDIWSVDGQVMASRKVNATNGYIDISPKPTTTAPAGL